MKTSYTAHMIISSITIILCSIINFIFTIIRKTLSIFNTISEMTESGIDYTAPKTWTDFIAAAANAKAVFTLSFGTISILQLICGVFGIIIVLLYSANKFSNKTKYFIISTFIVGIITSIFSIAAYFLLILSGQTAFLTRFILLFTMPVISVIFTRHNRKVYLNYKNNINFQYNTGGY